ncbi:MAG TPA: glutamate-5-semialdehyde dehydrogenase [Clostridiaceae bacterium]|nr:glutamate-5-semialdehyde dehydrogenase [Clostridiaceae bacterium]
MEESSYRQAYGDLKRHQRLLAGASEKERNRMLQAVALKLETSQGEIRASNEQDIESAHADRVAEPLIRRLVLDEHKLAAVCAGVRQVARLPDPIGAVRERRLLDDNLLLERVSVPIGVIGMIFESRPDALIQIISLALKSGNAIVLKGGHEALNTNRTLVELVRRALEPFEAGSGWIVHLEQREDVKTLLELDTVVDLLIPRGSNAFVRYVMDHTRIPVLGHADGICAMYIDEFAEPDLAVNVALDSKCQYPAACNAVETVLVHRGVAETFLPRFEQALKPYGVTIHGDPATAEIIACVPASEDAWSTEYLDYELAVKIVASMDEAIEHIGRCGSGHTDAIVTEDEARARTFLAAVDSADVFWNASTRFADGFRFGLGAEVGISTGKIHARGPVGLDGLVTDKWILKGSGQVVAAYESGQALFKHRTLPPGGSSILSGDA